MVADGREPADYRYGVIRSWLVTDDRERDWPAVREGERYKMRFYNQWFTESGDDVDWLDPAADNIPQRWIVGSASEVADELRDFIGRYGFTDVACNGAQVGVPIERMTENLERFANDVMPRFR